MRPATAPPAPFAAAGDSAGAGAGKPPVVSFVVPCYRLAHYLGSCIDSLLAQTYEHLEIIVIDDCSPDHTRSVVSAYRDRRIKYVRNEENLGHLRTYNKAIALAEGEYVWLISADDCLRTPSAVAKYLQQMQKDPGIVYAFSPAMALDASGEEGSVIPWTRPYGHDAILDGRSFLARLALGNCICAPSVMVRRACYRQAGDFPLDLPHAGDWYLWCAFAFLGRVAYLDEPLAYYRTHDSNMSREMHERRAELVHEDQARVRWRLKAMADQAGFAEISSACVESLALAYAHRLAGCQPPSSREELSRRVESIVESCAAPPERGRIAARIFGLLADRFFSLDHHAHAEHFYRKALRDNQEWLGYAAKLALLKMGRPGTALRRLAARVRKPHAGSSVTDG